VGKSNGRKGRKGEKSFGRSKVLAMEGEKREVRKREGGGAGRGGGLCARIGGTRGVDETKIGGCEGIRYIGKAGGGVGGKGGKGGGRGKKEARWSRVRRDEKGKAVGDREEQSGGIESRE